LLQRLWVIKCQQAFRHFGDGIKINFCQPFLNFQNGGWIKPRGNQFLAKRVGITAGWNTPKQGSLQQGCAASHERIKNYISRFCESFDKKPWQLWLETRPIRNLVKPIGGALF